MIQDLEEAILEEELYDIEEQEQPQAEIAKRITFMDILRNADFRNLWLGQIVSQMGDYFAFLAITVVISGFSTDPQENTFAITGMMISFTAPRLLFGLLAGVFVDRWDRRRTMLVSDLVRAGLVLLMIPAFMAGNLFALYGLMFVMSTFGTLFNPAKGALIPKLVPGEQLLAANSLSQTSQMIAVLAGPAIAGLTLKLVGEGNEWVAFLVDCATFLISAFTIWLIKAREGRAEQSFAHTEQPPVRRVVLELKEGLGALVMSRTMGMLTLVFAVTMLGIGAINVLWVVFLKTHFGFDGSELAWRLSLNDIAFSGGMLLGTMIAGSRFSHSSPKWYVVVTLTGAGLPLLFYGYVPDYWVALGLVVIMGGFVGPIGTGVMTYMQILVPNRLLGRVGGGFGTVSDTTTIVSMSVAGVAAALVGIPVVFSLAGVICVLMGLLSWVLLPNLTLKDRVEQDA